jgi:hypothetical protein
MDHPVERKARLFDLNRRILIEDVAVTQAAGEVDAVLDVHSGCFAA